MAVCLPAPGRRTAVRDSPGVVSEPGRCPWSPPGRPGPTPGLVYGIGTCCLQPAGSGADPPECWVRGFRHIVIDAPCRSLIIAGAISDRHHLTPSRTAASSREATCDTTPVPARDGLQGVLVVVAVHARKLPSTGNQIASTEDVLDRCHLAASG